MSGCESNSSVDTECGDGFGNYVEVTSTEEGTLNQTWRFYYLKEGSVPRTGAAGETIGLQGRSGSTSEYGVGIRITDEDGSILPNNQTESSLNEYVNTLTRSCGGSWDGNMCVHEDMRTSYVAAPFGPYHIHIDAGKNTLPPFDAGVIALIQEYMDAVASTGDCVDLNGAGANQCYEVGNTAWIQSCVNAHSHSKRRIRL